MFQDTRPAGIDASGGSDSWAEFRVSHPQERLRLLRSLRDGNVPVILNAPSGALMKSSVWAVDTAEKRLSFSADPGEPHLEPLVEGDEAVAVAYLESVKLQFDVHGLVLVRGAQSCALQCRMPHEIYRFQRRNAYRVRPLGRQEPVARFLHPSLPEMQLALRVIDVSIGGCALWLPHDVPPLQAGTRLGDVALEFDSETRFHTAVQLQHVTSPAAGEGGVRLGCEWQALPGHAERTLQRWIDQTQKRRRLLTPG